MQSIKTKIMSPELATYEASPTDPSPQETSFNQMTFHRVDEFGEPLELSSAERLASEQAISDFDRIIGEELGSLEPRAEGLDLTRVDDFMREQGIEPTPVYIIFADDLPMIGEAYKRALDSSGLGNLYESAAYDPDANSLRGWYDPFSDRTFVIRDPGLEAENGTEFTEAIIVHEQFHAASEYDDMVIAHDEEGNIIEAVRSRTGMHVIGQRLPYGIHRTTGYFLEEAAACYFEAKYTEEHGPLSATNPDPQAESYGVPLKYTRVEKGERVDKNGYGTAGYALELMIDEKPELLGAVVESRRSVQGLRDVVKIIDSIKPGLYGSLSRFDPIIFHKDNFNIVKNALEHSGQANGDSTPGAGHYLLRTEDNPEGVVKPGFVSRSDRAAYITASLLEKNQSQKR